MRGARPVVDARLVAAIVVGRAVVDWRACIARCGKASVAGAVRGCWAVKDTVLIAASVAGHTVVDWCACTARCGVASVARAV